jgi:hypothetical protein
MDNFLAALAAIPQRLGGSTNFFLDVLFASETSEGCVQTGVFFNGLCQQSFPVHVV